MQVGGTNQDGVRIIDFRRHRKPIPGQALQPSSRYVVEDLYSVLLSHYLLQPFVAANSAM